MPTVTSEGPLAGPYRRGLPDRGVAKLHPPAPLFLLVCLLASIKLFKYTKTRQSPETEGRGIVTSAPWIQLFMLWQPNRLMLSCGPAVPDVHQLPDQDLSAGLVEQERYTSR